MTVLVDHDLEVEDTTPGSAEAFLFGLLTHPYIDVMRYSDDGPPVELERAETPWGHKYVPGWAVRGDRSEDGEVREFTSGGDASYALHALHGNAAHIARIRTDHPSYGDIPPDEAVRKREADAIAALIAEGIGADLHITRREYLSGDSGHKGRGVTFCTPEEALPLVGLYLRRQGVFLYFRAVDGFQYRCSERIYFFTGALELLPEIWRWSNACAQHAEASGDDSLPALSSSLVQRVERVLQSRDDLFAALNSRGSSGMDALLRSLDTALIFMMGALDVSARVAHRVLGVSGAMRNAGWQSPQWLARVSTLAPPLAQVFADGSDAQHLLEILRKFRNSVHSEAITPLSLKDGSAPERIMVSLPRDDLTVILSSMDALGGRDAWGVDSRWEGRMHADPEKILELTFQRVLEILNAIMRETPVETLPGVHLTPANCAPPNNPSDRYSEMQRQGVRWQLGL
ncbi:hypothetical protein [Streptomyces sp. NPDC000961]|uniref:hypothetical protein n=1 Tax=Streptomyces sp. NPDC000961 TaxID=3364541 RepID=UPI0036BC80A9